MRYLVAQEIKSETRVGKSIYLFDFFFLIVYMAVAFVLANMVHSSLRIAFYIYSLVVALILTSKSYYNKGRRNYQSVLIMLRRDRNIYYPVRNSSMARRKKVEEEKEWFNM